MRAAQDLYEGIDVGEEGPVGLITYMRTDSVRVSDTAIAAVRGFIEKNYAKPYLPGVAEHLYLARRLALRTPTRRFARPMCSRRPEQVQPYLEPDQFRLYQLIWQRFVASQMNPAVYDVTVVDFDLGRYLLRATGSVLVFDGYHTLYLEGREAEEGKSMDDLPPIPPLAVGDRVEVRQITPNQHFTEPPPRFSEASLVKELERLGIGRPSTYAQIISTLTAREYVRLEQRRFSPTELGETVERIMVESFPSIFNVEFTSEMETELDKIEEGELGWQQVLQDFYGPFTKALDAVNLSAIVAEAHGLKSEELATRALSQVWRPGGAPHRTLRALFRLRELQEVVRLREVAQEAEDAGPAVGGEVPVVRRVDGDQDRPLRRVSRLHPVSRVQGHPFDFAGNEVPQVSRGGFGRATHQARQVVLGLRAVSGVRFLHLESPGTRDLPQLRLGWDGEEDQQGRGRIADLPEVPA